MTKPRQAERVRSLLRAQIIFGTAPTVECVVKNFSSAGVRLEIPDGTPLPNDFELKIPHKGRSYRARVAWRGDGIVGAEFLDAQIAGSAADPVNADSDSEAVDRLMKENARLRAQVLQLKQRVTELTGES